MDNNNNNKNNDSDEQDVFQPQLSQKETRQIVTPYAFHVSKALFGTPLAKPSKRGLAIGLDLLLISLIAQSASFILAGVAALTFFRAGNRLKLKKRFNAARLAMRFMAAVLLFVFAWGLFDEIGLENNEPDKEFNVESLATVAIVAKYKVEANILKKKVNKQECQPAFECWQHLGNELVKVLNELDIKKSEGLELLSVFIDMSNDQLTEKENQLLLSGLEQQLNDKKQSDSVEAILEKIDAEPKEKVINDDKCTKPKVSVVDWARGILEDMGLGFGWAAFYFCIFTAWWKGQTPGKKLMGIQVIKLDGSTPTLWESFGRYGGYGAGFATGLLGFLQVYWDPNRQAIQDKISETLVIDLHRPKVAFVEANTLAKTNESDNV